MAFKQNMKIPQDMERRFDIGNYDGGLNNVKSPFELRPDESCDMMNVISLESGVLETRPGLFKYITDSLGDKIERVFTYETDANKLFLLSSSTKLYKMPVTGGVPTVVCDVAAVIDGVQYEDKFYFVDGDKYRFFDGTYMFEVAAPLTYVGMAVAGTTTTITLSADASLVDDYYNGWRVYIHSGTGALQTRMITDYVGSTRVATIDTVFVATPDNTSALYMTSYQQGVVTTIGIKRCYTPTYFEFTDNFKGANVLDIAKGCRHVVLHKNRIWFGNNPNHKNLVMSSAINNMLYIPAKTYVPAITNNADSIKGMYSFNDVLTIFKGQTIFALYGFDETDYDLKEVTVSSGCANIHTVRKIGNQLYYLGSDGKVYALYDVRTDYKKLLTKSISDSIDLLKHPIYAYPDVWQVAHAVSYNGYYMLAVGDKLLVKPFDKGWYVWDNIVPYTFHVYNNVLLLTSADNFLLRLPLARFHTTQHYIAQAGQTNFNVDRGYLDMQGGHTQIKKNGDYLDLSNFEALNQWSFELLAPCEAGDTVDVEFFSFLPYNDNGQAYDSYYFTGDITLGYPSNMKQLKNLNLNLYPVDLWRTEIDVQAFVDYDDANGTVTVATGIAIWGVAQFGDVFQDRNVVTPYTVPINRRGRVIRFRVGTTGTNQPFKLYTMNGKAIIRNK